MRLSSNLMAITIIQAIAVPIAVSDKIDLIQLAAQVARRERPSINAFDGHHVPPRQISRLPIRNELSGFCDSLEPFKPHLEGVIRLQLIGADEAVRINEHLERPLRSISGDCDDSLASRYSTTS